MKSGNISFEKHVFHNFQLIYFIVHYKNQTSEILVSFSLCLMSTEELNPSEAQVCGLWIVGIADSSLARGMDACIACCLGRGFCFGLITHTGEPYRMCSSNPLHVHSGCKRLG